MGLERSRSFHPFLKGFINLPEPARYPSRSAPLSALAGLAASQLARDWAVGAGDVPPATVACFQGEADPARMVPGPAGKVPRSGSLVTIQRGRFLIRLPHPHRPRKSCKIRIELGVCSVQNRGDIVPFPGSRGRLLADHTNGSNQPLRRCPPFPEVCWLPSRARYPTALSGTLLPTPPGRSGKVRREDVRVHLRVPVCALGVPSTHTPLSKSWQLLPAEGRLKASGP